MTDRRWGHLKCSSQSAQFFVLLLLMGYQVSAGSEAAAFISGQSGGYPKTMSAETDKLRLQHVLSPASSTLRTSQTQVRYRSLPNELGTEGLHLPGSSNNNGVDSQALQTMLDEAVLVFSETANRDADARHEKKILDLIQEMSASLQLSADFRSLNEISQQEHRLQMARLLEEATQLYVEAANNGDYAAARKQRGRMQIFATKFRAMKIPDQMEAKNSIDLASFNSRLEEIKNEVESLPPTPTHQTSATTSRVPTLPTIETEKGTETTVAAKKDIAPVSKDRKKKEEAKLSSEKLIFPNDDHPDVDELEKLFVQAADLYKVSKEKAGPSQEDIKELLEEIDHVLQQAKAVEKEKEKENVMAQVEDRSRLKVAQEIEAALQLHMTLGDSHSQEILKDLASEFRTLPEDSVGSIDSSRTVSGTWLVSSLKERVLALQENQQQSSVEMAKELEQTKTTAISIEGEPHERGSTGGDSSQTTLPKFKPNYSMPMLAFKDGLKPNIALVQLLFDKATLLFTECSSSSSAIGEIHDLVEEIGNVLYCATRDIDMDNKEYTNTALVSAEKVMVSLEERLERLQQQTGLFFPDTSEKESLARTMPIRPEEAMPIEAASLPDVTEEAESIPPSVLNYPLEPMVDNSTLIGSIASFRQERPAEESVPAQPSDADSGREKGSKFSSNLKDAISDLGATLETNSSSALDATLKAMEPDTAPPAEQTSLESWLDATGVRYSASKETFNATKSSTGARGDVNVISDDDAKEAKTAASLKQDEPVPKSTPNMSAKMKSTPILDEAVWKEDVKSDLQALYELPSGSTAPDKTLWQASVDAGLRALHSPETEELRADSMTLKKTERKVSEAYDMTRPDSERLKNTDLEASDAIQKTEADPQKTQNMEQEVSDALSQAQSALDYADSAEVSIADQINSRMGGVVSKATDTVLDVTFRGAFFLASKALDAAFGRSKPKKKQTKKPVSKRGAKDIPAPKKDKSEQDAAVPFFATVKKTEEKAASSRLFSPQPPVSPPPLNSTIGHGDKTTLPGTNFSSSSGSGISPNKNSSPPDALGDVGAFESSSNIGGMSPALQGFLKRFGPKSSLFPLPQENDDDDQEPRSRDDLLPSTTLFYHSHTLSPRLSTRKMLSRALLGSRSDTLSKNKRHPLMSTIIGALVYPFLLRRVEPSLLVAAVLLQCFLLLRNSARS